MGLANINRFLGGESHLATRSQIHKGEGIKESCVVISSSVKLGLPMDHLVFFYHVLPLRISHLPVLWRLIQGLEHRYVDLPLGQMP